MTVVSHHKQFSSKYNSRVIICGEELLGIKLVAENKIATKLLST